MKKTPKSKLSADMQQKINQMFELAYERFGIAAANGEEVAIAPTKEEAIELLTEGIEKGDIDANEIGPFILVETHPVALVIVRNEIKTEIKSL